MPETLFIADLHLDTARPALTTLFLDFLLRQATRAEALYILGDLFEVWLGDDDDDPEAWRVAGALRALGSHGVAVYLQHGNRDLLLGQGFCKRSGVVSLDEETVINLYGSPTLLVHGDTLCTDDTDYQTFRSTIHDPGYQAAFLAKPLAERRTIVANLRKQSREATQQKAEAIMDVNPQAVEAAMRRYGVRRLIHGHTHRPAIHDFSLDGQPAQRLVLGDWYKQGSVLKVTPSGYELQALPLSV